MDIVFNILHYSFKSILDPTYQTCFSQATFVPYREHLAGLDFPRL